MYVISLCIVDYDILLVIYVYGIVVKFWFLGAVAGLGHQSVSTGVLVIPNCIFGAF